MHTKYATRYMWGGGHPFKNLRYTGIISVANSIKSALQWGKGSQRPIVTRYIFCVPSIKDN